MSQLAQAATVSFTDYNNTAGNNNGWIQGVNPSSGSITQDGVTFTLTLTSISPTPAQDVRLYAEAIAGVDGGKGVRLDSGNDSNSTADDETLRFSLSVSGVQLTSLSLEGIGTLAFAVEGRNFDADDGVNSSINVASAGSNLAAMNYDNVFNGLTALDENNVGGQGDGTWYIEFTARDWLDEGTPTFTAVSFENVVFSYEVIPEPSAIALLGLGGLGLILRKRR